MTQLWNMHFGHGQIWEHLEILICLIKLSEEWKCNRKGWNVYTEMHTVLQLEMMPLENEEPKWDFGVLRWETAQLIFISIRMPQWQCYTCLKLKGTSRMQNIVYNFNQPFYSLFNSSQILYFSILEKFSLLGCSSPHRGSCSWQYAPSQLLM